MVYKIKKQEGFEPKMLPIYKIKGKLYFRDVGLGEYRNVKNPFEVIPIDDVRSEDLEKPTKEDRKRMFGE